MMSLKQLVRRIDAKDYKPGQRNHYIYDPSARRILDKAPLLRLSPVQYFEVVCSSLGTPDAAGVLGPLGVTDPATGHRIRLSVHYEAWIMVSDAKRFVLRVASEDPGQKALDLVADMVQHLVLAEPAKLVSDVERVDPLHIERSLLRELGLSATLRLKVDAESTGPTESVKRIDVPVTVQLSDHAPELQLNLSLVLSMRRDERRKAVDEWTRYGDPSEAVANATRDFFPDKTLRDLRAGQLNAGLRARVERVLAQRSLELRNFQLAITSALAPVKKHYQGETQSELHVLGYPKLVPLFTQVSLQLENEALYYSSGTPDLQKWIDEHAHEAVRRVLFATTYSELCLNMPRLEELIRAEIQSAAREIGYTVRAHVTKTYAPENDLLSPFSIELEGDFATAFDGINSSLSIVIRSQLESLYSVAREMNRGVDLLAAFREAALQETRSYLHTIAPGFLFTRFTDPKDYLGQPQKNMDQAETPSVERALQERIRHALSQKFGLKVLSFTVKLGPSTIHERYKALMKDLIKFQVDVQPYGEILPVPYHGTLRVEDVDMDGWPRFQNLLPTPEKVAIEAAGGVRTLVGLARTEYKRDLTSLEISKLVTDHLPERLRETFGICVRLDNWFSDAGETAAHIEETNRNIVRMRLRAVEESEHARLERLRELRNQRDLLEDQPDTDPEQLERIDARIERLEADVSGPPAAPGLSEPPASSPPAKSLGRATRGSPRVGSGQSAAPQVVDAPQETEAAEEEA